MERRFLLNSLLLKAETLDIMKKIFFFFKLCEDRWGNYERIMAEPSYTFFPSLIGW